MPRTPPDAGNASGQMSRRHFLTRAAELAFAAAGAGWLLSWGKAARSIPAGEASRSVYLIPAAQFTIGDPGIRDIDFYHSTDRDVILAANSNTSNYYLYDGKTDAFAIHASLLVGKDISLDFNVTKMGPVSNPGNGELPDTLFSYWSLKVRNPNVPGDELRITLNSKANSMPLDKIKVVGNNGEVIDGLEFNMPKLMQMPEVGAAMAAKYASLPDTIKDGEDKDVPNPEKVELGEMQKAYRNGDTKTLLNYLAESYDNASVVTDVVKAQLNIYATRLDEFAKSQARKVAEGETLDYAFPALTGPQISRVLDCTTRGVESCIAAGNRR